MEIREIILEELNPEKFIEEKVKDISSKVGSNYAINALSGGVDSSVVTMIGYKALGDRLKTCFIDSGLMREGEPDQTAHTPDISGGPGRHHRKGSADRHFEPHAGLPQVPQVDENGDNRSRRRP